MSSEEPTRRSDTIVITSNTRESFADVVAKLKHEIKPEEIGITVKKLTRTEQGNVKNLFLV